jgi:hypothetical protein
MAIIFYSMPNVDEYVVLPGPGNQTRLFSGMVIVFLFSHGYRVAMLYGFGGPTMHVSA